MKEKPRKQEEGLASEEVVSGTDSQDEVRSDSPESDQLGEATEQSELDAVEGEELQEDDADSNSDTGAVQLRIPKKLLWSGLVTFFVVLLGLAAWYFGWYERAVTYYNAASITLKVRESDTFVVEGANISLNGTSYTTDSTGKVVVDSIVAGEYPIKIEAEGYYPLEENLQILRGDNELKVYSLTKLPAKLYTVTGFVFDYVSDAPLTDAQVTLGAKSVRTAPSGEYSFDKLVPGTYSITITRAGYLDKELSVEITEESIVSPEVKMVPVGQVIFVSNRDGKRALYSSGYDGQNQQRLVEPQNGGEDYAPVASPDGKWIVFSSTREGTKSSYGSSLAKLYLVSRDGKELRKINDDVSHSELRWSANSRFIYYGAYADRNLTQFVRRVYDITRKSTFDFAENIYATQFNPAGTQFAYSYQVQVALPTPTPNPEPSGTPWPTPTPTPTVQYEWRSRVELIDLTNGERRQLTEKAATYFDRLSYSPDGGTLFYEATANQQRRRFQFVLASSAETEVALPAVPDTRTYVYSPSRALRAFVEVRDGKGDIFTIDGTGGNEKRLTSLGLASPNYAPVWDATGAYVLFTVSRSGESAVYIVSAAGGTPKKIVDVLADTNTAEYYGQ